MGAEKYLGGASDPGEWWRDMPSEAEDLGPGVSFYLRVACDEQLPPRIIIFYGLREDVCLDKVIVEANRLISLYKKEGRKVFGELVTPRLEQWKSLEEVLSMVQGIAGENHGNVPETLWWVTGSGEMVKRIISLVGIETLQGLLKL